MVLGNCWPNFIREDGLGVFEKSVVNIWNRLPASVVQAPTVNNFKKRLDDWSTNVDF